MITREEFVKLSTEAIVKTRNDIVIRNQMGGYLEYHREIKEQDYFTYCRDMMIKSEKMFGYSLFNQYELIKKAKMGSCNEISEYLSVEIIMRLQQKNVDAELFILHSKMIDHMYLHVKISLENEKSSSLWEIDAWDPRIIDVSSRPNGTIKNNNSLFYGTDTEVVHATSAKKLKRKRTNDNLYLFFREPIKGRPERDATPERDIFEKHPKIYEDYTLEQAYEDKMLDIEGNIRFLQRKSNWQ